MSSLQDKLIQAISQDNQDYGALRSWGYTHTRALLETISDLETRKALVNDSYLLDNQQVYPLEQAQDKKNALLFKLLLEAGADPLKKYPPRQFPGLSTPYTTYAVEDALTNAVYFHRVKMVEAIAQSLQDKSKCKDQLALAKSQVGSGWYKGHTLALEEYRIIIELLTPPSKIEVN